MDSYRYFEFVSAGFGYDFRLDQMQHVPGIPQSLEEDRGRRLQVPCLPLSPALFLLLSPSLLSLTFCHGECRTGYKAVHRVEGE